MMEKTCRAEGKRDEILKTRQNDASRPALLPSSDRSMDRVSAMDSLKETRGVSATLERGYHFHAFR
jgi:hypothetical protein